MGLRPPPKSVTVQVDSREKTPLLFPATARLWRGDNPYLVQICVEKIKLDGGDYRLKEYPAACIIERKGSVRELAGNFLTGDSDRQCRAFGRLVDSCSYPLLLLETGPSLLMTATQDCPSPDLLVQRVMQCCMRFHLHLLIAPRVTTPELRRVIGGLAVQTMLAAADFEEKEAAHAV
jgi:hypothetical protein